MVGWIGAGRMGAAMVRRLLAAGHDVTVYNRTRAKADALGCAVADTPAQLADRDVVFTMVAAPQDLLSVTTGEGGLLTADARPALLVDCSTVSDDASAAVRAVARTRGTAFLAAPISGNPSVVESGLATFVTSGPREAYEHALPLLCDIGRSAVYAGTGERARLVKIAHNLLLGVTAQALAEIVVMVEKAGVPRAALLEFLNDSVVGSSFTRYKTPALVGLDWTPTFTPQGLRKDMDLGLEVAERLGAPLPLVGETRDRLHAMVEAGLTNVDFQALLVMQAAEAQLELVPERVT